MRINEKKVIMTKVNGVTKTIKVIKIEKANEAIKIKTKIKENVNSGIRISIIIFIMRRFFAERVSTRERVFKVIKSFINMLFIKRLCDVRACEKTSFNLLKCEQCDINHVVT